MTGFEVSGWLPQWDTAREQLARQREELLELRGRRIVDSWLVWNHMDDSWFTDLPVVLMLDNGRQLEVSWKKFDELSITWNSIDLSIAPVAWNDWPLSWRSQAHEALRAVAGHTIISVLSTEHRFTTRQVAPKPSAASTHSVWLVGGIWLETDESGLHIFNALDENGLSNDAVKVGEGNRLRALKDSGSPSD